MVEGVYRGGQAAVQAEDLTVHKGCLKQELLFSVKCELIREEQVFLCVFFLLQFQLKENSYQWEIIKQVGEVFPHIRVAIFAQTLVIEPVDLQDNSIKPNDELNSVPG